MNFLPSSRVLCHSCPALPTCHLAIRRRLLFAPGLAPPQAQRSTLPALRWAEEVLPTLQGSQAPLQCVQGAGEVLYLPKGWLHATVHPAAVPTSKYPRREAYSDHRLTK